MTPAILPALIILVILTAPRGAWTLEPIHLGLVSTAFQYTIFPIVQERGYMKEENIDLRIVMMQTTPNIQALITNDIQFTGAGTSALVAMHCKPTKR